MNAGWRGRWENKHATYYSQIRQRGEGGGFTILFGLCQRSSFVYITRFFFAMKIFVIIISCISDDTAHTCSTCQKEKNPATLKKSSYLILVIKTIIRPRYNPYLRFYSLLTGKAVSELWESYLRTH